MFIDFYLLDFYILMSLMVTETPWSALYLEISVEKSSRSFFHCEFTINFLKYYFTLNLLNFSYITVKIAILTVIFKSTESPHFYREIHYEMKFRF